MIKLVYRYIAYIENLRRQNMNCKIRNSILILTMSVLLSLLLTSDCFIYRENLSKEVEGFSQDNIFSFTNFETKYNDGDCLGIALVEKEYFMNNLVGKSNSNNKIELGISKGKKLSDFKYKDFDFEKLNKSEKIHQDDWKMAFDDLCNDIDDMKNENKDIDKAIKTIIYYHIYGCSLLDSISFSSNGKYQFDFPANKHKTKIDIRDITKKIDRNEPVVLGFRTSENGHAVLGYRYEYTDDKKEKLQVFAVDPNASSISIRAKTHILFTKNEGEWKFEYKGSSLQPYGTDITETELIIF